MDQKNKYTVYMHVSPSGKKYIGVTSIGIKNRWKSNGSGYKKNKYFWSAIQKYGWDSFEHILIAENLQKEKAFELERFYIWWFKTNIRSKGYNHSEGGESGAKGYKLTEEQRRTQSEAHKGIKHTDEWKRRSGERQKGENNPNYRGVVVCKETGECFNGTVEAAKFAGVNKSNICACLRGRTKTSGGYHWERLVNVCAKK